MTDQSIIYPKVSCRQKNAIRVKLRWFAKYCNQLIGEEPIDNISLQDIQDIFEVYIDNELFNVWHVNPTHVHQLQQITKHNIQINKFTYFIEQEGGFPDLPYSSRKCVSFNKYYSNRHCNK